MYQSCACWARKHEWAVVLFFALLFLIIRIPALSSPLHQDEYKWPLIANPATQGDTSIPHPPLSEFIYRTAGEIIGFNVHFRLVPLFFGLLNIILFYFVLRRRFGRNVAGVGGVLFILSYFSILASLMVDVDGAIMPFFFLCMMNCYDIWRFSSGVYSKKNAWLGLAVLFAILGLFIKVSFILAVGAVAADFLWSKRSQLNVKAIAKYIGFAIVFIAVFIGLLILSQKLFPFFNLSSSLVYWEHFADIHHNWFQTMIQLVKALLYASPFLVLVPFLTPKSKLSQLVPYISYLIFGFIFYIILFDFSLGALDRYLQFIVIPLCAISAVAIVGVLDMPSSKRMNRKYTLLGCVLALGVFVLCFLNQNVPSLYPKSAWISRVFSLHWNFLYPFSGGSGPLGFYISFAFIAVSWIVSLLIVIVAFFKPGFRKKAVLLLIPLGLVYNLTFAEEYMFGRINGSASRLLGPAIQFIQNDPAIQKVVVYNDNGGWEIRNTGKYVRRLYADPSFTDSYKNFFEDYSGDVLYIDVPRLDPSSFYAGYLQSCTSIYSATDQYINAKIFDCKK